MTLTDLEVHFSYFCLKICVAYFLRSLIGNLTKDDIADDLEYPLKVISCRPTVTLGHFTLWISLSVRPKTETKRLNFGLSPMVRLTNHRSASSLTSSATHSGFCRISVFIFELSKK